MSAGFKVHKKLVQPGKDKPAIGGSSVRPAAGGKKATSQQDLELEKLDNRHRPFSNSLDSGSPSLHSPDDESDKDAKPATGGNKDCVSVKADPAGSGGAMPGMGKRCMHTNWLAVAVEDAMANQRSLKSIAAESDSSPDSTSVTMSVLNVVQLQTRGMFERTCLDDVKNHVPTGTLPGAVLVMYPGIPARCYKPKRIKHSPEDSQESAIGDKLDVVNDGNSSDSSSSNDDNDPEDGTPCPMW